MEKKEKRKNSTRGTEDEGRTTTTERGTYERKNKAHLPLKPAQLRYKLIISGIIDLCSEGSDLGGMSRSQCFLMFLWEFLDWARFDGDPGRMKIGSVVHSEPVHWRRGLGSMPLFR
jgi:hypothetical protein